MSPRNFWWFLSLLWLQILSVGSSGKRFFSASLYCFRWLLWELVALFFWLIVIDYDVKMIYKIQKSYNQMIGIYVLWGNHIDIWNITESNGKRRHRVKHDIYIFYHSESMSFISLKINLKVQNVFSGHMWIIPILSYKTCSSFFFMLERVFRKFLSFRSYYILYIKQSLFPWPWTILVEINHVQICSATF